MEKEQKVACVLKLFSGWINYTRNYSEFQYILPH